MLRNDDSPFVYTNLGYSTGWIAGIKGMGFGGPLAGIGAGAKFKLNKKQLMILALGYRYQQIRQWQVSGGVRTKATRDAHIVNFKIRVVF